MNTPTSPSLSHSKKLKTEHDDDDFERVKRYLLECPHVPNDHPAIRAAVDGLDKEQKRRDRDLKLQAKFTNQTTTTTTTTATTTNTSTNVVVNNQETTGTNPYAPPLSSTTTTTDSNSNMDNDDDSELMEWQDVERKKEQQLEDPSSYLGKQLSQVAIHDMALHNTKVSSPLAAIAVVLHACLRSERLGFSCTGIPEPKGQSSSIGFALPIRELPKTMFLPPNWDSSSSSSSNTNLSLRYRKPTMGALVLSVTLDDDHNVSIQMIANDEPHSESLEFPLTDHINLDSWNAAQKTSGATMIAPALHYKALHQLVTNVVRTFDLGAIDSEPTTTTTTTQDMNESSSAPYVDTTIVYSKTINNNNNIAIQQDPFHRNNNNNMPIPGRLPTAISEPTPWQPRGGGQPLLQVPETIHQAFGRGIPDYSRGDFADDLTPGGGLTDPLRMVGPGGRMGGNMMGPNHPMFNGGPHHMGGGPPYMGGGGGGGPGSMQPRFDPFLPPGVDPEGFEPDPRTQPQQRPRPRRRPGEPNPDHLQPPNAFGGGDMFS